MTERSEGPAVRQLRLWPGVAAVMVQWLLWVGVPLVLPDEAAIGLLGGVALGAVVLVWWLFFSRAPWIDRVGAIVVMVLGVLAVRPFVDVSIATGMMGRMLIVFSIAPLSLALVAAAVAGRRSSASTRRVVMTAAILAVCAAFTLVRTEGVTGGGGSVLRWRWTPTAEERLLAEAANAPAAPALPTAPVNSPAATSAASAEPKPETRPLPAAKESSASADIKRTDSAGAAAAAAETGTAVDARPIPVEWPGFRGPKRDSVIHGSRIATDWAGNPPAEIWRRSIGPGWSSFAVAGDLIYTQEQRGEHEIVSCYRLDTGEPVWQHRDNVRFYESNGGAGPRATPLVRNGRVYTHGATGIVNALDARTGARIWSRNAQNDTGAPMPGWGFTGSPVWASDAVIVSTSGRLVAYEAETGKRRWTRQTGGGGYSSPHLVTIDGIDQIIMLSGGGGVTSVAPRDGAVLWQLGWREGVAIVQPAVVSGSDLLTSAGDMMGGQGIRRISISHQSTAWKAEERWTTRGLKPYFNDLVVHEGHAYGFDGTILACINLDDGERRWKGGRYGAGQMLLLADQDLLLVLSEEGELALVKAAPDEYTEVARFKAIEGKTWNHPVLVRDVLLVRNGEEMAAFRLPLQGK